MDELKHFQLHSKCNRHQKLFYHKAFLYSEVSKTVTEYKQKTKPKILKKKK